MPHQSTNRHTKLPFLPCILVSALFPAACKTDAAPLPGAPVATAAPTAGPANSGTADSGAPVLIDAGPESPAEDPGFPPLAPLPSEQHCFDLDKMRALGGPPTPLPPPPTAVGDGGVENLLDLDAGFTQPRLVAPSVLSETGCFKDTATLTLSEGIFPYEMNSPLWTDGAIKQRFVSLPPGTQIKIDEEGFWDFPVGSALLKNFIIEFDMGHPESQRPVETRVALRAEDRWHFYSYVWKEDGSDALLLEQSEWLNEPMTIKNDGEETTFDYLYPDEAACQVCHGNDERGVVGPRTSQLNREINYGGALMNQLDALDAIGAFEGGLPLPAAQLPAVPDPKNEDVSLEQRARSYLDANCAHCHRPGGWVPPDITMDLRFETQLEDTQTCEVNALYGNIYLNSKRISAGDAKRSALWRRMQELGLSRMPMLGTVILDPTADVVGQWIESLESCPQ